MIIGLVVVVVAIIIGIVAEGTTKQDTVTVGSNESFADCDNLCLQWDRRRQERCNAEADEASARANVDKLVAELAVAVALAAAIWAAYLLISWTGPAAIAMYLAALAASALAGLIGGRLASAEVDLQAKVTAAKTARDAEAAARTALMEGCKDPARVNACLGSPSPC